MLREFRVRPAALYSALQEAQLLGGRELTERGVVVLLAALIHANGGNELRLPNKSLMEVYGNGAFVQMSDGVDEKDGGATPTGEVVLTLLPYQNRKPIGVPVTEDVADGSVAVLDVSKLDDGELEAYIGMLRSEHARLRAPAEPAGAVGKKVLEFKRPRRGNME
jgi:hypothetical protein